LVLVVLIHQMGVVGVAHQMVLVRLMVLVVWNQLGVEVLVLLMGVEA
jgi:hypothetical protein